MKNFVERFPHEKIYNPVHFYGDRIPMDREIKGEKSPQCTMKDLHGESGGRLGVGNSFITRNASGGGEQKCLFLCNGFEFWNEIFC